MQFLLDKSQKSTLLEQARGQLLAALHVGSLRAGDRLPSVRQVALHNGINLKTAFSIYQRLHEEGFVNLRTGSGAYVSDIERTDLEQAYCISLFKLVKSNLSEAGSLKLDPHEYAKLVQSFIEKPQLNSVQLGVIECNEEQINLFSSEISNRLNVCTYPILLSQLESPCAASAKTLARMSYFATTHFHFKEVQELTAKYQKKLLQLRLNPAFIPQLVGAARQGRVLMVVSNTSYFPAFRRSLLDIGTSPAVVKRITAVDHQDLARVRAAMRKAQTVYVSSICDPHVCKMIPTNIKELKFNSTLSLETMEALEAVMLFHPQQQIVPTT